MKRIRIEFDVANKAPKPENIDTIYISGPLASGTFASYIFSTLGTRYYPSNITIEEVSHD